jgi:NADPH2:quinone reductase
MVLGAKGSLFLTRPSLAHYILNREELLQRAGQVMQWVKEGNLQLRIEHQYPLSQAAKAHQDLESRATTGKLILLPD